MISKLDGITVDGRPLPRLPETRLWRYHKPSGLISTHRDPTGRPTVFDCLPKELGRVVSVGRLDLSSEGLLLLTTSGKLARHLELPSTGWTRRYRVRAFGSVNAAKLAELKRGVTVGGVRYGPIVARVDRQKQSNVWLTVSLTEGKNREVRRVLEHLGLTVNRLIRIGFGPFQLGNLAPGEIVEVPRRVLRDQLGQVP
jgi:23S rRNA pseudouridine2605 synthase